MKVINEIIECESRKRLITYHGGEMVLSTNKNRLCHGANGFPVSVRFIPMGNSNGVKMSFLCEEQGLFISTVYDDGKVDLSVEEYFFDTVLDTATEAVSVKVGANFLSARKDGSISLVGCNQGWEKFFVGKASRFYYEIQHLSSRLNRMDRMLESIYKKIVPYPYLRSIEYHLADHCNYNCWGCDHFSPLAEKVLTPFNMFKRDMDRLSQISCKRLGRISLMGGEPLLNPDVIKFMEHARECFPDTVINLCTNGILLDKQDDSFWDACSRNNINILITDYSIKLNLESLDAKSEKFKVSINHRNPTSIKSFIHCPLDEKGGQDPVHSFLSCHQGNTCMHLRNGRLYPCNIPANIHHYNRFFSKNLKVDDRDSIDIFKAESMDDILSFLSRPIPFCRYCDVDHRTGGHPVVLSKKSIKEWTGVYRNGHWVEN